MMDDKEIDQFGLDAYFEAGRDAPPLPSEALLGRIMADAEAQLAIAGAQSLQVAAVPQRGLFAGFLDAIGGWASVGGMATATIVGVWIGFSQPAGLDLLADQLLGDADAIYLVDLAPAFGTEFEEG